MAKVEIHGDELRACLSRVERLLAVHESFTVPLSSITGVTVDPGVGSEPKGIRAPGTHVPGLLTLGTYRRDGLRTFWAITRGSRAVCVTLTGTSFDRLVVDVADPYGTVETLNRARSTH
jgi:hypothetical protein